MTEYLPNKITHNTTNKYVISLKTNTNQEQTLFTKITNKDHNRFKGKDPMDTEPEKSISEKSNNPTLSHTSPVFLFTVIFVTTCVKTYVVILI